MDLRIPTRIIFADADTLEQRFKYNILSRSYVIYMRHFTITYFRKLFYVILYTYNSIINFTAFNDITDTLFST